MSEKREVYICLLDDDQVDIETIVGDFQALLKSLPDVILKTFTSVDKFFEDFNTNTYVAILDHNLGSHLGFDVVSRINQHNKENPDEPCRIIIMSGTNDIGVCAHYMNTQTARFYADKNDEDFYERLVGFTKIAFRESAEKREEACMRNAYIKRQEERKKGFEEAFAYKYLNLSGEASKDGHGQTN